MLVITIQHIYNGKSVTVTASTNPGPGKPDVVSAADTYSRVALNQFEDAVNHNRYV